MSSSEIRALIEELQIFIHSLQTSMDTNFQAKNQFPPSPTTPPHLCSFPSTPPPPITPAPNPTIAYPSTPQTLPDPSLSRLPIRRLSPTEIEELNDRGLCYNCEQIWSETHRCRSKYLILFGTDDDDEDDFHDPKPPDLMAVIEIKDDDITLSSTLLDSESQAASFRPPSPPPPVFYPPSPLPSSIPPPHPSLQLPRPTKPLPQPISKPSPLPILPKSPHPSYPQLLVLPKQESYLLPSASPPFNFDPKSPLTTKFTVSLPQGYISKILNRSFAIFIHSKRLNLVEIEEDSERRFGGELPPEVSLIVNRDLMEITISVQDPRIQDMEFLFEGVMLCGEPPPEPSVRLSQLVKCVSSTETPLISYTPLLEGFEFVSLVAAGSVGFYSKWGRFGNARKVFNEIPEQNVVSWAAVMNGYVDVGDATHVGIFADLHDLSISSTSHLLQIAGYVHGYQIQVMEIISVGMVTLCGEPPPEISLLSYKLMLALIFQFVEFLCGPINWMMGQFCIYAGDNSISQKACLISSLEPVHMSLVIGSRFSNEEASTFKRLCQIFCGKIADYMMVVFASCDNLGKDKFLDAICNSIYPEILWSILFVWESSHPICYSYSQHVMLGGEPPPKKSWDQDLLKWLFDTDDCISALSDDILVVILSPIMLQEAAITSILAMCSILQGLTIHGSGNMKQVKISGLILMLKYSEILKIEALHFSRECSSARPLLLLKGLQPKHVMFPTFQRYLDDIGVLFSIFTCSTLRTRWF